MCKTIKGIIDMIPGLEPGGKIRAEFVEDIQKNLKIPVERGLVKFYQVDPSNGLPIHIFVSEHNKKEAFTCCPRYNLFTTVIPEELENLSMKELITYISLLGIDEKKSYLYE